MRDKKKIIEKVKNLNLIKESDFDKKYQQALEEERQALINKDQIIKKLESDIKKKGMTIVPAFVSLLDIL